MTEAVGFRVTSDIVAIICFVFAFAYFVLAGGLAAFRSSCKKQPQSNATKRSDNDFIRQLAAKGGDGEENVSTMSKRSRKSSGFHMLGATPTNVNKLRVQQTFEEYELMPASPTMQGMGQIGEDRSIHRNRIHSDIDGTPPGRRLNESNDNTPTRIRRGGSFYA